jgi:two-component system sensor histidine kinase DegS
MNFHIDSIEKVINKAKEVIVGSQYQIFEISENARAEKAALEKEMRQIMEEIDSTIDRVDQLESDFRRARIQLSEVSRDFHRYTEEDIRSAYEKATLIQMDLMIFREKELNLRARRDDLQQRIRQIQKTIERAEAVSSQMNVVIEYLSGNDSQFTRMIESVKHRQLLGLKIILAQEEERKRISREIHDGPAQSLANLVLRTEIVERMLNNGQLEQAKIEVGDLRRQVRMGLEEVRKIIYNLRPMSLDDLGLIPILRKFTQDFEEKQNIRTRFEVLGIETRLPAPVEVAVYRLVQEAFSNVLKHANATYVSLEVTFQPKVLKIVIQDNGDGFDQQKVEEKIAEGNHFGLVGMRERVELLEGSFHIDSAPGRGTKLTLKIPIRADQRKERGL